MERMKTLTERDSAKLLSLPDDALLAVLAFLPPMELFSCRVVCRRLRHMCLHPHLWRSAKLQQHGLLRAALRLAPRVKEMVIVKPTALAPHVRGSRCVVEALDIMVRSTPAATAAKSILLTLAALGGLREVRVYFRTMVVQIPLLKALYSIEDLRILALSTWHFTPLPAAWCKVERSPSLRELRYSRCSDPFLELLLRTHASTLEVVEILTDDFPTECLARLPRLRSLTCHVRDELFPLAALPHLTSLKFTNYTDRFPPGALKYLRHASRLRSVSFTLPDEDPAAPLLALADSPSSRHIETLRFRQAPCELVAAMLHKFPALQSLTLIEPRVQPGAFQLSVAESLLEAISHVALTSLTWESYCYFNKQDPADCFHAWLHGPAVQSMFAANPRLHLRWTGYRPVADCSCAWCLRGCHTALRGNLDFSFASHIRRPQCPRDCFQVAAQAP